MRRVNQKLSEISALATQSLVAESNIKQQGDDSPTSTDSSTSTLKDAESVDSISAVAPGKELTSPTLKEEGRKYKYDRVSNETKSYTTTDGLVEEKKNKSLENTSYIDSLSYRSKYSSKYNVDTSSDSKSYTPKTSESSDSLLSSRRTSSRTNSIETSESPKTDSYSTRRSYEPKYKTERVSSPSALDNRTDSKKTSVEAYKSGVSRTTSLEKKEPASDSTYKTRIGSRTVSLEKDSSDGTSKTRVGSRTVSLEKDSSDGTSKTRVGSRTTSLEKDSSDTTYKTRISSRTTSLEKDSSDDTYKTRIGSRTDSLEIESRTKYSARTVSLEEDYATYKSRFISSRKTSYDSESTTKPRSGIRTTSIESDTDYNSSESRSSSLETAPLPRKYSSDKTPLESDKPSYMYSDTGSTYKSATLDRSYKTSYSSSTYKSRSEREKLSDYTTRSQTLGRKSNLDLNSYTSRSSTLDRKTSRQVTSDVTSLDPKTAKSVEKSNRIKRDHHRPVTPEPQSPRLTETKLLHSPEKRSRRKSEGNHPINHQVGKFLQTSETLHEGDEEVEHLVNKEEKKEDKGLPRSISQPSSRSVSPTKPHKADSIYTSCTFQSTLGRTPVESAWGSFRTEKGTSSTNFRIKHKDDDSWLTKRNVSVSPKPVRRQMDDKLDAEKRLTSRSCNSSPKTSPPGTPTSPPSRKTSKDQVTGSFGSCSSAPTSPTNVDKEPQVERKDSAWSPTRPLSPKSPESVSSKSSEIAREKMTSPIERRNRDRDVTSPVELRRREKGSSSENGSPKIVVESSKDATPPPQSLTMSTSTSSSSSVRTRLTTSPARDFRRHRSPDTEKVRQLKADRRKTPIISPEALDMLLSGNIPEEDALETCQEEEECDTSSPEHRSSSILKIKSLDTCPISPPKSPEKKVTINSELLVEVTAPTPVVESQPPLGERTSLSSESKERTRSLGNFSPEPESSPVSPEEGESPYDAFSRSMDMRRSSRDRLSRLRGNSFSNSLSMSLSMTDLSDIGKKETKARRVGRSNSRRLVGRSKVDSYVTDSRMSPSHQYTTGSVTSSTKTLPGRLLSGKGISSWRTRDRDTKKSEKSRYRLW